MEVRCPNCNVRYDLDAELVKSGPVRLQCSACDTIFRLQVKAKDGGWLVRRQGQGEVLELDGLPELQRWIVERRVTREDEISRSGKQWKPLGSITELASFFAVIDQLEKVSSSDLEIPKARPASSKSDAVHEQETRAAPSPEANSEATVKADAKVLADLSASIEEALDSGELGVRSKQDEEKLTEALLESLGIESSGVRRPVSGVQDPQKLRQLLSEQSSSADKSRESWSNEPIQLEATAIEVPQHKITEVGGTEALPVARPTPHLEDSDEEDQLDTETAETVARPADASSADAARGRAEAAKQVADDEPTTVRPAKHKTEVPDIGPTGADWFVEKEAQRHSRESGSQDDPALETHVDREITHVGRKPGAMMWVAIAVIVVVAALAVVLVTQTEEESTEEEAAGTTSPDPDENKGANRPEPERASDEGMVSGRAVNGGSDGESDDGLAIANSAGDPNSANGEVGSGGNENTPAADADVTEASNALNSAGGDPDASGDPDGDTSPEGETAPEDQGKAGYSVLFRSAERDRERGRYDEAIRTYERALGIKKTAEARAGVGWAYLAQGKSARAVQEFKAALDYSGSYQQAYTGLAKSYEAQGDLEKSLDTWERYLSRYPSGSQSSIARAQKERLSEKVRPEPPPGENSKETADTQVDDGQKKEPEPKSEPDPPSEPDSRDSGDDGKKIIIIKKPK